MGLKGGVHSARPAEATRVVPNYAEMRRQDAKLSVPHSAIEIAAVEQHHDRSGTEGFVVETAVGDGDESCGRTGVCHHQCGDVGYGGSDGHD